MAMCFGRNLISRWRIVEYQSKTAGEPTRKLQGSRDTIFQDVISIIELDTPIRRHPHTKRLFWLANSNFSSPANVFLALEPSLCASGPLVDRAWRSGVANYDAREAFYLRWIRSPMFGIFSRLFIKTWEIREEADSATMPRHQK